jgi:hypothetical protein
MPLFLAFKTHECAADWTLHFSGFHVFGVHPALAPVLRAVSQKYVVMLIFGILETFEFVQSWFLVGKKRLELAFGSRLSAASL